MKTLFQVLAAVAIVFMGSTIVVAAEPTLATPAASVVAPAKTAATTVGALTAKIVLTSRKELTGTIVSSTQLGMSSSVGPLDVPLSQVAGIKMASDENNVTTVVLHNGDSLTGAVNLELLELETDWGKADVIGPNIDTILFAQDLDWKADEGFAGKRWGLVKKTTSVVTGATPRPSTTPNAAATATGTTPSRTVNAPARTVRYYYNR